MQSLLQGRTQLRPFLPAPSKQKRGAVRAASTCRCSLESSTADRRTLLVALLSLGFAAQAEAKTAAAPAKRDAYEVSLKSCWSFHIISADLHFQLPSKHLNEGGVHILWCATGVAGDCQGPWRVNITPEVLQAGSCPEDSAEGHCCPPHELATEGRPCEAGCRCRLRCSFGATVLNYNPVTSTS